MRTISTSAAIIASSSPRFASTSSSGVSCNSRRRFTSLQVNLQCLALETLLEFEHFLFPFLILSSCCDQKNKYLCRHSFKFCFGKIYASGCSSPFSFFGRPLPSVVLDRGVRVRAFGLVLVLQRLLAQRRLPLHRLRPQLLRLHIQLLWLRFRLFCLGLQLLCLWLWLVGLLCLLCLSRLIGLCRFILVYCASGDRYARDFRGIVRRCVPRWSDCRLGGLLLGQDLPVIGRRLFAAA